MLKTLAQTMCRVQLRIPLQCTRRVNVMIMSLSSLWTDSSNLSRVRIMQPDVIKRCVSSRHCLTCWFFNRCHECSMSHWSDQSVRTLNAALVFSNQGPSGGRRTRPDASSFTSLQVTANTFALCWLIWKQTFWRFHTQYHVYMSLSMWRNQFICAHYRDLECPTKLGHIPTQMCRAKRAGSWNWK